MSMNVTQKLIKSHLMHGDMKPSEEIGIRIDQTLTQDATGTLVMLELEAMGLDRVNTEVSVQYVDHRILWTGHRPHATFTVYALPARALRKRDRVLRWTLP